MSDLTIAEATALMAAGMYASPPTEEQMHDGLARADAWLIAHNQAVKTAVRAQIAADIREARFCEQATPGEPHSYDEIAFDAALNAAARIAEGSAD